MKPLLRLELKKALAGKWFIVSVLVGCAIATASALMNIRIDSTSATIGIDNLATKYFDFSYSSCYKYWLAVDYVQPFSYLFFWLWPLLSAMPFAWSYCAERKSGYAAQLITRAGKTSYLASKAIASFVSGALAITIPLMLNFAILACMIPARTPDVSSVQFFGIYEESPFSELFYNNPAAYCFVYLAISFFFGGTWALFSFSLSLVVRNRIALIIGPYIALLLQKYLCDDMLTGIKIELSPFALVRGTGFFRYTNEAVIAIEITALLAVGILLFFLMRKRDLL